VGWEWREGGGLEVARGEWAGWKWREGWRWWVATNGWRDGSDARRGLEVGQPLGGSLERS
jgi:hypothetical protein